MACENADMFTEKLHDCTCAGEEFVAEKDPVTGKEYTVKKCLKCLNPAYSGLADNKDNKAITECKVCPVKGQQYDVVNFKEATCVCSKSSEISWTTAGDICMDDVIVNEKDYESYTNAKQVSYTEIEAKINGKWEQQGSIPKSSGVMSYFYLKSAVGCIKWK